MMKYFFLYILVISLISAVFFVWDKYSAQKDKRRISEYTLHMLELFGGVFVNLILMYAIHHKNKKWQYFSVTWLIFVLWIVGGIFYLLR